jgi:hypothetical protein
MNELKPPARFSDGVENSATAVAERDRRIERLRSLDQWYASELERRLGHLTEVLREELLAQVREIEATYKEKLERAAAQPALAPPAPSASPSVPPFQGQFPPPELVEEIARIEASLAECSAQHERLMADDTAALGRLLRIRSQELELKAYLRGLKYSVEGKR